MKQVAVEEEVLNTNGEEAVGEEAGPQAEELHAEEEIQPQQVLSTPSMRRAEEVELHRTLGHIQYRAWCDECVEGRGRELGHVAHKRTDRTVPIISSDYLIDF